MMTSYSCPVRLTSNRDVRANFEDMDKIWNKSRLNCEQLFFKVSRRTGKSDLRVSCDPRDYFFSIT